MRDVLIALRALSDETRLRILSLLMVRECCVCEVMQALGISQTRASRNLGILHDAGFLRLQKDGLWSLYSIDWEGMDEHRASLVQAMKKALKHNNVMDVDAERLGAARRVGPGCARELTE